MPLVKSALVRTGRTVCELLEMVKFEHTLFALPFALMGMLLAADGLPAARVVLWILVAMVSARSAAMGFNRIIDRRTDALNPRTSGRALPTGRVTTSQAAAFVLIMIAVFVLATYALNPLAFRLGPLALVIILGYSYSKRFTWLCHLWLGLAIGMAPTAAWIAVTGSLSPVPLWLTGAAASWVAGFDILYGMADQSFDRAHRIHAIPARFGPVAALGISRVLHVFSVALLLVTGLTADLGSVYYSGVAVAALALAYEQSLVRPNDLSKLNTAFFTVNGFVSVALLLFVVADWALARAS
jgi:4-hydroxybenzoate polyprenyltransferase